MAQLLERDFIPLSGTGNVVKDRPDLPPIDRAGWVDPLAPFAYRIHGLTLLSQLKCPELTPGDVSVASHAPVTIRLGAIPRDPTFRQMSSTGCVIHPRRLHLWIEGVGSFLALAGTTIIVDPVVGSDPAEVRLYLLGLIIGTILHQRGVMVLHASAIQTPAGAVAFAANSGVGKSTLAMAMHLAGYPLLTDDLCTVRHDPRRGLWVAPGTRRVKLHPDTAALLGLDIGEGQPVSRDRDKLSFVLAHDRPSWLPLVAVYVLEVNDIDRPHTRRLGVGEAYQVLTRHTYRRDWLEPLELQAQFFHNVVTIIGRLPIYRLVRSNVGLDTDALINLVEEVLNP